MKSGVFGGGTYRVLGNFVFSGGDSNDSNLYPHSVDVWEGRLNWSNIIAKIGEGTRGSADEAAVIEATLNQLQQELLYGAVYFSEEELQLIRETLLEAINTSEGDGLFLISESITGRAERGTTFEDRFSRLLSALTGEDVSSINTASNRGAVNMQLGENITDEIIQNIKAQIPGILQDITLEFNESQGLVHQKIINPKIDAISHFEYDVNVNTGEAPKSYLFNVLQEAVSGKSFSLKSYKASRFQRESAHIGKAESLFRVLSSVYSFAAGDNLFPNICTFVFSSLSSGNATVVNYISQARLLYELTGAGQSWDALNNRLVDYLVVADSSGGGGVRVFHVSQFLEELGRADYNSAGIFSASGELNLSDFILY